MLAASSVAGRAAEEEAPAAASEAAGGSDRAPDPGSDPQRPAETQQERETRESLQIDPLEWVKPPPIRKALHRERWKLEWRDGFKLTRQDGAFAIRFGGRLLGDAALIHENDSLDPFDPGWDSDLGFRQIRLYAAGVVFWRMLAKAELDFLNEQMLDVYIGFTGLGPFGTLQLGYMKEPFSLEERTSFLAQTLMERSLPNVLAPGRNSGFLFSNTLTKDERLFWAFGGFYVVEAFGGQDDIDDEQGGDEAVDIALRVSGLPIWRDEGRELLEVGVSYSHRFNMSDAISFSSRPESFLAPVLLDTGDIVDPKEMDRFGVESAWVSGPWSIQGEAMATRVERKGLSDLFFWGAYLKATHFLTGERRIYGRRTASFGRVVPRRPFAPQRGHWGALEAAARVSYVDLTDDDVRGGRELNASLGLNWYLLTHVHVKANYIFAWFPQSRGVGNIVQLRIQLDY